MANRILQFGTSRFLQAHVDLFVDEARATGQDIGPITIVKTTQGGPRAGRTAAFGNPEGFPVHLRGYENGKLIDNKVKVKSVVAALDANQDWQKLIEIFIQETEIVVSNVGDGGYMVSPADRRRSPNWSLPPESYPAKLLELLIQRYKNGGKPLLILPCELIGNNGQVFRKILEELAETWGLEQSFLNWLKNVVMICDTLVDRIVSEAIEPVGAVAEPYGLWAIKREPQFREPLQNRCIVYTDDLQPYLRLKLHILNLGHTFLAGIWQGEHRPADETIREILGDVKIKQCLLALYDEEIVPGFAARKMGDAAKAYVAATLERFENPFLNHRISDIADNHAIKIVRRMADFMAWAREGNPALKFPSLEQIVRTS